MTPCTCIQAWKNGLVHPQYTFLTYAWYNNEWWMPTNESDITCSIGEMKSILEYTLSVTQCPDTLDENAVTEPAGIVSICSVYKVVDQL